MFSSRLPGSLAQNRMAQARERRRSYIDLTESNPTRAGLTYPAELLAPLASADGLRYEPAPLGLPVTREAISGDYRRRNVFVPPNRIVVTASTSEAYSILFKLLCDAGDNVLIPQPGYPLFEHLTRLDAVEVVPYELEYHGAWHIDLDSVARGMTERTRAVLVVSPNNPTGSVASARELSAVGRLCAQNGAALIGDEVFADYPLGEDGLSGPSILASSETLTFGLGGLSKTIGLPQVKLGWIGVAGPDDLVRPALERLEVIGDTYLSVSTPVQLAAPQLLAGGAVIREQICTRIRSNLRHLRMVAPLHPSCTLLNVEAGWYAVIQVPATMGEEARVLELLERDGVLVHPGYFFDFPREAFLVLSLLPESGQFGDGIQRLFSRIDEGTK
ncbi:MAG TPA: pyridoxal phosphate-dependent aminotransferase [Vicinamibacterales bacterium]